MLVVERHGGRATDKWRVVWMGNGTSDSDHAYHDAVGKMRQGGVRLRDDITGEVLREQHAPRLRTRW